MPPNETIPAQPPQPPVAQMQNPPVQQAPAQTVLPPAVNRTRVNDAGAVFFVMLIVGFTFHLPLLLELPVLFFCVAAGLIFFRDVIASRSGPVLVQTAAGPVVVKAKRSTLKLILLIVFGLIGIAIALFVAFIAFIMILFSTSGGF